MPNVFTNSGYASRRFDQKSWLPTRHDGPLRAAEELERLLDVARVGADAGLGAGAVPLGDVALLDHVEEEVERHLEEHRARARSSSRRGTRWRCTRRGASSWAPRPTTS
jgi:hypothetical protein